MDAHRFAITIAFLVATGTSAILNFLGMKHLVFYGEQPGKEMV
jgi:hypothetical protein